MTDELVRMTDININEPITITLPAWLWLSFMGAVKSHPEFQDWNTNRVLAEVEEALIHPADYKEMEAEQANRQMQIGPFIFGPPGPEDL